MFGSSTSTNPFGSSSSGTTPFGSKSTDTKSNGSLFGTSVATTPGSNPFAPAATTQFNFGTHNSVSATPSTAFSFSNAGPPQNSSNIFSAATSAAPTATSAPTTSLFGTSASVSAANPSSTLFGAAGSTSTGSLFGNTNLAPSASATPVSTGFLGSQTAAATAGNALAANSFSSGSSTPAPASTSSSNLFGAKSDNTFSFGTSKPTVSIFSGQSDTSFPSNSTTATTTSGNLFGNIASTNTNVAQPQQSSLFGSASVTPAPQTSTGGAAFGFTAATPVGTTSTTSIFGTPATTASSAVPSSSKEESPSKKSSNTLFNFGAQPQDSVAASAPKSGLSVESSSELQQVPALVTNSKESVAKIELTGLSVEKIIAKWHENLEAHLELFGRTAEKVRNRDLILFENQQKITALAKQAQVLKAEQSELQWNLDAVAEHQNDLASSIDQLEKELEILEEKKPKVFNQEAAFIRKETFDTISLVNNELISIEEQLKSATEKMNSLSEIKFEQGSEKTAVRKILETMASQQINLQWLLEASSHLEEQINTLKI